MDTSLKINKHDVMLSDFQQWQSTTFKDKMDAFEDFSESYKVNTE